MNQKSISKFIITPDQDRKLTSITDSGFHLHNMMGDEEEGRFLNRIGLVKDEPLNNPILAKEGDRVIVQHNVFRQWLDYGGDLKHSNVLNDGTFFVDPGLIYAYERNGEWYSEGPWVFLDPTVNKKETTIQYREEFRPDKGTVVFNQRQDDIEIGDFVSYKIGKYIPTIIDGKEYYKILHKHILINHGKI